jgi:hypothetical protein
MSVYVGIDVHRKRSQVAVVDEAGEVLKNRNVVNGVESILAEGAPSLPDDPAERVHGDRRGAAAGRWGADVPGDR